MIEFTCKKCGEWFETAWSFGEEVRCPHCGTWFSTDYDFSIDDEEGEMLMGPWLDAEIPAPSGEGGDE